MHQVKGPPVSRRTLIGMVASIAPASLAALSIPAGMSNGLPVGWSSTRFPAGHDSELLGLGIAVEKVLGSIPARDLLNLNRPER